MVEPNTVGDADLASTSIPERRKPPKLRRKRPVSHALDEDVEKEKIVGTVSTQKQAVVSKTSDDESNFEDTLEGESSAIEAQLQPVPERQRQTIWSKPFRNEEKERDVAEDEDVPVAAERQRLRRGRRGEQTLIQSNTIDNAGRTVGQSSELVLNRTDGVVGTITDTSGRVLGRPSEKNEQLKKEDDEQLRLRLELNLDLEVQLKAKISGDLTLTLLLVFAPVHNEFGYSSLTQ
ncbi:uncharacterized protein P174DRAFT_434496 [Aspergillus novofumigatus IBT 16806]|uniref:Uncharacterized protein n=1 Tax=Aspergillus novofumigatus (strain IBT 16806) TaxID=1392255 RepID=A0A2I1BXH4_ASPN1|nr:uncharacterized protein P174DRAFT_434496 [Aspergillus novofumigatus IBT 16806]PKX90076.1 hypothetical protein P174DRAFT_434496 [Aspergillus novofumigatus IBT 16806]